MANFFKEIPRNPYKAVYGPKVGGFMSDPLGGKRRREKKAAEGVRNAELGQLDRAEALFQDTGYPDEAIRTQGRGLIDQGFNRAQQGLRANFASRGMFRSGPAVAGEAGLDVARASSLAGLEADIARQRWEADQARKMALAGLYGQRGAIIGQPIATPKTDALAGAFGQLAGTAAAAYLGVPMGAGPGSQLGQSFFGGGQQQPPIFQRPTLYRNLQPRGYGQVYGAF